jgi:hypothetical protein
MSLVKVIDPTTLPIICQRLLPGKLATLQFLQSQNQCYIARTFQNLDFVEDELFYNFGEFIEECISCKILKHKVDMFEFDLDTIILHINNDKIIIQIENTESLCGWLTEIYGN